MSPEMEEQMDPNIALMHIRNIVADIRAAEKAEAEAEDIADLAHDLADVVDDLDRWISKGGFRPDDWNDN